MAPIGVLDDLPGRPGRQICFVCKVQFEKAIPGWIDVPLIRAPRQHKTENNTGCQHKLADRYPSPISEAQHRECGHTEYASRMRQECQPETGGSGEYFQPCRSTLLAKATGQNRYCE